MRRPRVIAAVTFDAGGTLIEPWPSVGHIYAEVAKRHGAKEVSCDQLSGRFKQAWSACAGFDYSRAAWERVVAKTFDGICEVSPEFFSELYDRFAQPGAWRIFDDVLPVLRVLQSRGVRMAVVSNWDDRLRPLLRELGLDRYFEALIISCETGYPKPQRAIFQRAADCLQLEPEVILHVGDSEENDVRGAESAGFNSLRIARGPGNPGPAEVRSLLDLPNAIWAR